MKPEFVVNKPKSNSRPKKVEKNPKILRIVSKWIDFVHNIGPGKQMILICDELKQLLI